MRPRKPKKQVSGEATDQGGSLHHRKHADQGRGDASDDDDIVLEAGDASDDHASLRHCKPADQASGDASEDGGRQRPRKSKNQARGPVQRTIFV